MKLIHCCVSVIWVLAAPKLKKHFSILIAVRKVTPRNQINKLKVTFLQLCVSFLSFFLELEEF